ncbi:MAG: hypothetical protein RL095_1442 [Verrucomicrobiota bacterium]|jgi:uncharacterized Tic20 family protein
MTDSDLELPPPTQDEKMLSVLCHISFFLGLSLLLPLVVYLIKKDESAHVAYHAKEALNAALSYLCYSLICIPLCFILIGIPLLIALLILNCVVAIVATVKAIDNIPYRYPMIFRLV